MRCPFHGAAVVEMLSGQIHARGSKPKSSGVTFSSGDLEDLEDVKDAFESSAVVLIKWNKIHSRE